MTLKTDNPEVLEAGNALVMSFHPTACISPKVKTPKPLNLNHELSESLPEDPGRPHGQSFPRPAAGLTRSVRFGLGLMMVQAFRVEGL